MKFHDLESAMGVARILVKPTTPTTPHIPRITPSHREIVAGGEVLWKPVDKSAAMLLAKSPDINKPNHESKPAHNPHDDAQAVKGAQSTTKTPRVFHKHGTRHKPIEIRGGDTRKPNTQCVRGASRAIRKKAKETSVRKPTTTNTMSDQISSGCSVIHNTPEHIAPIMVSETGEKHRQLSRLEAQMVESRKSLQTAMEGLRDIFREVDEYTSEAVIATRASRMTAIQEISQLTAALRDIRKFFVGPEHKEEVARLREFTELCERIAKIKKDGTLDAVAETIIKLA
jgi:hypothetical protein